MTTYEALQELASGCNTAEDVRKKLEAEGIDTRAATKYPRSQMCPVAQFLEKKTGRRHGGTASDFSPVTDDGYYGSHEVECPAVVRHAVNIFDSQ